MDYLGITILFALIGILIAIFLSNRINSPIRRTKIEKIGETIGWKFQPKDVFTSLQHLPEGDEINILQGEIEGIPARIFDLPQKIYLELASKNARGAFQINGDSAETILLITFPSGKIPTFKLRPKALGDNWRHSHLAYKNYIVEGNQDKLKQLFNHHLSHYAKQKGLYIEGNGCKLQVQFNPHHYLPATKESYVNLIAEGEFITKIVKTYLDSTLSV